MLARRSREHTRVAWLDKTMDSNSTNFELLGETFSKEHMPILYSMVQTNRENAERQLQSIANAWHNGSIVSAAQALESDMAHDSAL